MIKRVWQYVGGLNSFLLVLYCTFITVTHSIATKNIYSAESGLILLLDIVNVLIAVFAIMLAVCPLIIKFLDKRDLKRSNTEWTKTESVKYISLFFVSSMVVTLTYYIGFYPGSFMVDSFMQYSQVISGNYTDWHPFLHTLLSLVVPMKLTGGWYGSVVLFQCIGFSAAFTYALYSLLIYTNKKFTIITMLFILLNPQTGNLMIFVGKDASFAIVTLLLVTYAMHIFFSNGAWIRKPVNAIALILVLVVTTLIRHNAILFTGPLLIATLFFIPKRKAIALVMSFFALLFVVKGPVYNLYDVEEPGSRQVEILGLPMTMIGAAVKYDYDSLDEDVKDFAMQIAPKEVWETYEYGDFNTVKFHEGSDMDIIEEMGIPGVLKITVKCLIDSPKESLMGALKLTDAVYTIADDHHYYNMYFLSDNDFGIELKGISVVGNLLNYYTYFMCESFSQLFTYLGVMHLLLICALLSKCRLNKWVDWKKILLVLPVFAYNFGTMLLLTRAADSARFFYYTFLITPILFAIIFKQKTEQENDLL